ncbi:MAG: helix-turn-helix domain-containing protein [Rouxiella badensis]|jgi:AraC-like DNA-binding protein|uniref:helix-turn-helix domain-containing protein n=1 Tax=Rouxiella badensis TaxID=1646377 RepID=UPI0003822E61
MRFETIPYIIKEGETIKVTEKKLCLIEALDSEPCEVLYTVRNNEENSFSLQSNWRGLIALDVMQFKVSKGRLRFFDMDLMKLVKLQVFIDYSNGNIEVGSSNESNWLSFSKEIKLIQPEDMEYWLLQQAMQTGDKVDSIVAFLRHTECYNLVHFLLSETDDNNQCLQTLCVRYGLSAAHFRRLTRHALGHTTKVTLREWRMTKAILAFINDPKNMTDIAFAHGYSSLSHFSNDVKKMLGMTPRALRKSILDIAMK